MLGFSRSHSSILANLPRTLGWLSARAFLQAYCKEKCSICYHPRRALIRLRLEAGFLQWLRTIPWSSCQSSAWSSSFYTWKAFASFLRSWGHWWLQASHKTFEHLLRALLVEACWLQGSVKTRNVKCLANCCCIRIYQIFYLHIPWTNNHDNTGTEVIEPYQYLAHKSSLKENRILNRRGKLGSAKVMT